MELSFACKLQFLKPCSSCNEFYDDREEILGVGEICRKCIVRNLRDTKCAGRKRCCDRQCRYCFELSFASHDKALYWHPSKNGNIKPRDMRRYDRRKFWFTCPTCSHDICVAIRHVQIGSWCGYCRGKRRCKNLECKFCFNNSFASHERAKYWHPAMNGNITPRDVARFDGRKYWFICDVCKHNIHISLTNVQAGNGCVYCTNQNRCGELSCELCFNNSLASHEKAKYWHPTKNGSINPQDVAKYDDRKYWFICNICTNDICMSSTNIQAGKWCVCRTNKTESKFRDFLSSIFDEVKTQFRLESCRSSETGKYFPFDFCLPSTKVIIEIDGRQHFQDIPHWKSSSEHRRNRDIYKMHEANRNGYSVIRIIQEDIWGDTYDWQTDILSSIEKCKVSLQNIFCSSDKNQDVYNAYKLKIIIHQVTGRSTSSCIS